MVTEGTPRVRTLRDEGRTWREFAALEARRQRGARVPRDAEFASGPPVIATIESRLIAHQGNWVTRWGAHCRLNYGTEERPQLCAGYELVDPADPRFMCFSCWNRAARGAWRRVQFPEERERIERLIMARPDPRSRAFLEGETLFDLVVQNGRLGAWTEAIE
jgi:hypothetical protein